MLTRKRLPLPILTGDWKRDGPALLKALNDYFLSLEGKEALTLDNATGLDNTPVGANAASTGAFTTLSATGAITAIGGQIAFPATQVASADANTLDDYEEGLWTPTLTFATAGDQSIAYSIRNAWYTKIGRVIVADFEVATSAFTFSTASGALEITGLPFAASSDSNYSAQGSVFMSGVTVTAINAVCRLVGSTMDFIVSVSGGSAAQITKATLSSGTNVAFRGSITYRV